MIDGDGIYSSEGNTQGDPLGMHMYTLATIPLIKKLSTSVLRTWYANDGAATGNIANLRLWWDEIYPLEPSFGCHVNALKTWLGVKKKIHAEAEAIFGDTGVKTTSDGRPHLCAPLGTCSFEYVSQYVSEKIQQWSVELKGGL